MTRTAPWATPSSPTGRRILLTEPATLDVALPPSATSIAATPALHTPAATTVTVARPLPPPVRPRRPEDGRPRSTRVVPPGASSTPWPTPARRTPPPPTAFAPHALARRAVAPHALAPHAAPFTGAPHRLAPPAGPFSPRPLAPARQHAVRRRHLARVALAATLLLAPALGLLAAQAGPQPPSSRPVIATAPIAATSLAPGEPTAGPTAPRHAEDDHEDAALAKEVVATPAERRAHRHQNRTA